MKFARPVTATGVCLFFIFLLAQPVFADETQAAYSIVRSKGHGYVTYEGSGIFHVGGDGILIINKVPAPDNATTGEEEDETNVIFSSDEVLPIDDDYQEPACIKTKDGRCIYLMVNERVWIEGDDIEASFAGANIGLTASGDATLMLQGYGMYFAGSALGRWSLEGTTILLE